MLMLPMMQPSVIVFYQEFFTNMSHNNLHGRASVEYASLPVGEIIIDQTNYMWCQRAALHWSIVWRWMKLELYWVADVTASCLRLKGASVKKKGIEGPEKKRQTGSKCAFSTINTWEDTTRWARSQDMENTAGGVPSIQNSYFTWTAVFSIKSAFVIFDYFWESYQDIALRKAQLFDIS